MMLTTIATAFGTFKALPRWVHYGIAAAMAVLGFLWWLDSYGDKRVAKHEAGIEAELNAKASDAASLASTAAWDTKAEIDADTARGLAKASGSADPLREAFGQW